MYHSALDPKMIMYTLDDVFIMSQVSINRRKFCIDSTFLAAKMANYMCVGTKQFFPSIFFVSLVSGISNRGYTLRYDFLLLLLDRIF